MKMQVLYNSQKSVKKRKSQYKKKIKFDLLLAVIPIPTCFMEKLQSGVRMMGKHYKEKMQGH